MWLVLGVAVLVVLMALPIVAWATRRTETMVDEYELGPTDRVTVDLDTGDIHVITTPSRADTVEVTRRVSFTLRRPTITGEADDAGLVLRARTHPLLFGTGRVDHELAVPPNTNLTLHTKAGATHVTGGAGQLDVRSSTGTVHLEAVAGRVRVESSSGGIVGSALASTDLEAHARAGSVELAFSGAPDRVDATSGAGSVEVVVPTGSGPYRVDAHSSAGTTHVEVPTDPASSRQVRVRSSTGSISILPTAPSGPPPA